MNLKSILTFLLLFSLFNSNASTKSSFNEILNSKKLWKGYGAIDKDSKVSSNKIQQFIYFKKDSMFLLNIVEQLNMTNGEIDIKYVIDKNKLNIDSDNTASFKFGEYKLQVELVSKTEIICYNENYQFPFKAIPNTTAKSPTSSQIKEVFKNKSFTFCDPKNKTPDDNLNITFNSDERAIYKKTKGNSSWTSAYSIIEFGNTIYKLKAPEKASK